MRSKIAKTIIMALVLLFAVPMAVCAAPEKRGTTAGNLQNGGYAVESGGWIYYYGDDNLIKTKPGGSNSQVLVEGVNSMLESPFWGNLNVADGWIYFNTMHGTVYKVPASGGKPQVFLKGQKRPLMVGVNEFLVADGWMYYNYETGSVSSLERTSVIFRIKLDGTGNQVVTGYKKKSIHWLLDVVDGYVYYTGFGQEDGMIGIYRIPATGGKPELFDQIPYSFGIQIIDDWVYYTSSLDGNALCKIRTDGSGRQVLYGEKPCGSINVAGDWVYFSAIQEGETYDKSYYVRIRTDGSDFQILSKEWLVNPSVAGDLIVSMMDGAMRIKEGEQGVYLEQISARIQ